MPSETNPKAFRSMVSVTFNQDLWWRYIVRQSCPFPPYCNCASLVIWGLSERVPVKQCALCSSVPSHMPLCSSASVPDYMAVCQQWPMSTARSRNLHTSCSVLQCVWGLNLHLLYVSLLFWYFTLAVRVTQPARTKESLPHTPSNAHIHFDSSHWQRR